MLKNRQYFSSDFLIFFFIFLICFSLLSPSFFLPWSLIDDGDIIFNSQKIFEGIRYLEPGKVISVIWENQSGRFRPVYWFYNFFAFLIGGKNPFFYHFLRFINFFLVCLFLFLITKEIGRSRKAGFFAFLFFAFSFLIFENWYRLGPQEPLSIFCLALALFFLLKKKTILASWLFLISFFIKETNIIFLPVVIFLFLIDKKFKIIKLPKKRKATLILFLGGIIALIMLFLIKSPGSYSSSYQLELKNLYTQISSYFSFIRDYFGYFPFISFLGLLFSKKEKEKILWFGFLFLMLVSSFLIILPWSFSLRRYLLLTVFFLSILLGIGLEELLKILKDNLFLKIIILSYFLGLLIQNGVIIAGTFYDYIQRENVNAKLVAYLNEKVRPHGQVYLNLVEGESTIEYIEEIKLHLTNFYNRADIKINYLKDIRNIDPDDLVVLGYIKAKIEKLPENFYVIEAIEKKFKTLIVTTPTGFVKRLGRLGVNFLHGDKKIPEGIYTFYYGYYWWKIYKIRS